MGWPTTLRNDRHNGVRLEWLFGMRKRLISRTDTGEEGTAERAIRRRIGVLACQ